MYSVNLDKECTFKPHLVTRDSKLSKSVLQDCVSHHEDQYCRRDHTPAKSPIQFGSDSGGVNSGNISLVFDRLSQLAKDKIERRNLQISNSGMLSNNNENIDPKTGQPLFRPQTGRSPRNERRVAEEGGSRLTIGEHLYGQHKAIAAR